ncbi:guanylate kinase [Candidatus Acetothermia bacterium]|nr:guanylate kinase [Candidatus Acetothermia bacterium]MBI3643154.1 guanylate kinase [Candidatus Acetothermia bacterium]
MKRDGILFVLSGPSGVGKSTVREKLISELGLIYSISATTRAPRAGEKEGIDYEFITTEEFERRVKANEFVEWARVFGRGYGTPKIQLLVQIKKGNDVLLEIDVQGADQIRMLQSSLGVEIYYIFILPPSLEELRRRQQKRGSDSFVEIEKRFQWALVEISHAHEFDFVVVNKNVEETIGVITEFMKAARSA